MNENIKQLAAQTRGDMVCLTTVDDVQWKQHEEFVEKFAKLIIQECVRACIQENPDPRDSIELQCANRILKRFGIE